MKSTTGSVEVEVSVGKALAQMSPGSVPSALLSVEARHESHSEERPRGKGLYATLSSTTPTV